ncbi:MAG TPA: peptidoglycan DD-metalloendopeptidase family protein [Candidatus Eisenbacteria bacterium]|nr:peptidoglycan DD-metalloendopeptidase family protein [Candidatus Eisenbacteria bacterium]
MKARARGAAFAILALVSLLARPGATQTAPANPPAQQPQQQPQPDEDAERKHLEEVQKEAAEKRRRAQILQGKENTMLKDLHATEGKLRKTRSSIRTLNVREKKLNGQLVVVRSDLDRSTRALESRREILADRLRGLYKLGRLRELGYLLSSESFAQLFIRTDYLVRIAREDRVLLLGIRHEKDRITANQTRLDHTLTDVERTSKQKKAESQELDRLRARKQVVVSSIQNQRKDYEAAAAELEQTARRIQSVLAELERRRQAEEEARRKGLPPGQQAPLEPYSGNFGGTQGSLPWPVRGDIVGHFGNETNPKFGTVTFNSGIDIAAPMGTDVKAVAKGRVDMVSEDFGSYGEMIILNHGDGYYTLYAHLSASLVGKGQDVAAGQTIGRVGDTGSLKGSILHFEVRKGRTALNPTSWLR